MNRRWLGVHLPAFRLERCGYGAGDSAVLIGFERNAMRVLASTPAARDLGIRLGMSVSEARSLEPGIEVEVHDPAGELTDRGALVKAFERISDVVQAAGPQDLLLEVAQTVRVHEGEPGLLRASRELAATLGHVVQLAIADEPRVALALARRHRERVVPSGGQRVALADLPVASIGRSAELVGSLQALGITTLGQLAALDVASVAGRFGAEGVALHRLANGEIGREEGPTTDWIAPELPSVSTELAGATTTLQLHFVLPGLLTQLSRALAERDLAAVQLRCVLELDNGSLGGFGVRVGRPTRDPDTLGHLLRNRLETVRIEAPVESWRIEVQEAVPAQGWQPGLTERAEAREPLPDLLARLTDALGEEAVFSAEPVDSWCPERAWRAVPFALHPSLRRPPVPSDDVVDRQERWERLQTPPRPSQVLSRPELIEVMGEPPARVRLPSGWARVEARRGPEALSGHWWDPESVWSRRYWAVELAGGRAAWIFESEQHWWLHGWF